MDIDWKILASAIGLAIIPAFGAYMIFSIATNTVAGGVFFLGFIVFAYLFYQKPTIKSQSSSMFFILSVESLLTPLMFTIYTFVFAAQETSGDLEQAGAAIGGVLLVGVAFLIGVPTAGVFYILYKKLGSAEQTD